MIIDKQLIFRFLPVVEKYMVAKRSYGEAPNISEQQQSCGEAPNNSEQQQRCDEASNNNSKQQQQVDRDYEQQPEAVVEEQSYDPDFLDLWASEFETNSLFPDNRRPHEKPPNEREKTTEVTKFKIPLKTHRATQSTSPAVVHTVKANPFARTKEQIERKNINQAVDTKRSGYLDPEHPLRSRSPNSRHRMNFPPSRWPCYYSKPSKRWTSDESTQTTFDCNNCLELLRRVKAAEQRIKELQKQLDDKQCNKCNKRTKGRNIRNRIKQTKIKEFFRAHVNKSYYTTSQE